MTVASRVVGYTVGVTGLSFVLSERQEMMLAITTGVSSKYKMPWSYQKTFGHLYDDAFTALGRRTIAGGRVAGGLVKKTAKHSATRAVARGALKVSGKVASRAIPVVGWAMLAYDVGDFLIGDDPSFIGDVIDWVF